MIKNVKAPAIGQEGLERLMAFCTPKRMTSQSTLFDAGYEQAKRDFREKVFVEIGIPDTPEDTKSTTNAVELSARRNFEDKSIPWWGRW